MICLQTVKQFCKEYWKIENYQEAVNDTEQVWHCHHRHEIDWALSREELISIGRYYDVHYSELIFLTPAEHKSLHHKGKIMSKESRQKMREAKIGKYDGMNNPMYGIHRYGVDNPNYKYHITEEELYNLYVVQELSAYRIAKMYGCSQFCIHHKLKKFNISKSKS